MLTLPCSTCGHHLVNFDQEEICPKCTGLSLLDSITSITIWERRLQYFTDLYNKELARWDVEVLLGNLAALREELSRNIIKEYGIMQFGKLASYTLLLDRIIRYSRRDGRIPQSRDDVTNIVNIFEKVLNVEDELLRLKSCYGNVINLERFDLDNLEIHKLLKIFLFVENEKYNSLRKTAAIYDIYSESESKEVMERYKAEEQSVSNAQTKYRHFNPDEFITTNYKVLNGIYAVFLRNNTHAEVFGRLREFGRLIKSPYTLMEFVWQFRLVNDKVQTFCPTNRAAKFFNESKEKVKDVLIYDRYNKSIFPLFVRFNVPKLGNAVVISHRFSFFIYTFLHAILTEDLFNAETAKRSLEFEKQNVKDEFERHGFLYIPDIVDKKDSNLQIDGLAIKGDRCYVVECRGWRLNKLIDERQNRDQVIRDLKGIVIGEKYTTKNGSIVPDKKPSLIKKIAYLKDNVRKYLLDDMKINNIEGLIVTISYLPIHEYQGIKMISVEEIANLS